jgi:adenylyltransferase/sulfurtransferase
MDATDMTFTELKIRKSPTCPACGNNRQITRLIDYEEFCGVESPAQVEEVSPRELKRLIDSGKGPTLLDVREPFEHALCHIERSTLIPLGDLPRRFGELNPRSEIVIYCHSGNRSARAVEFLSSKGFTKVRNLKGGITAWAEQVDSKMPGY